MLPLSRASRICIFCSHFPSRFYASAPTPKGKRAGRKPTVPKAITDTVLSNTTNKSTPEGEMPNAKSYKSRIEAFLEDLDASSKRPTLQDLYNMKPSYAVDFEDASYEQEYQGALKKVMNAFKNDQMLEFINALKHEGKLPTSRRGITEVLLDKSWGWATPHKAKKLARQRVEHVLKEIPITPALLLVLLSADVHAITKLAQGHDLRLSVQPSQGSLIAEGLQENISNLISYLNLREEGMVSDSMQLKGSVMPSMLILRLASRISGAYIEASLDDNFLKITASDQEAMSKAKRTMKRYLNQTSYEGGVPVFMQIPFSEEDIAPPSSALYPFISHKSLTWSLKDQRLFRVKQVMGLLEENEPEAEYEGLGPLINFDSHEVDLAKQMPLLTGLLKDGYTRSWTASVGHVVHASEGVSIGPPIPGKKPLQEIAKLVKDTSMSTHFLPSLPSPLLTSNPESIATVHRAIYRRKSDESNIVNRLDTKTAPSEVFILEVAMQHIVNAPELDDLDEQDSREESISLHPIGGPTRCRVGIEETVDILMPDRPMDMRLTVLDLRNVDEHVEPEELQAYLDQLLKFLNFTIDQQPSAPEALVHEGVTYVLDTSASVRRTEERLSRESSGWDVNPLDYSTDMDVISETSLDLESKEKSSRCILHTKACQTQEDWDTFMAQCVSVTSIPFTTGSSEPEHPQIPYFSE